MLPTQSVVRELESIPTASDQFLDSRLNFMHAVIILLLGVIELSVELADFEC